MAAKNSGSLLFKVLIMKQIGHFIDGAHMAGSSGRSHDIFDPNTGRVQSQVNMATASELDAAVKSAAAAQIDWAKMNPQKRARVMFAYKEAVEAEIDSLAAMLSSEHGKVLADSRGDVMRGIDVIEFACGIPHSQKGEHSYGAGPEIDVYSMRKPLGVVAGITPFNFPAMIPMWMFGMAIATGNACILKPSEKDPSVPMRLAEIFFEVGGPKGLLQCINGDKEIVDAICDHDIIKAVSFVGSSDIAQYVYARASANGKRAQCMGGAKNHGIIMPDANMDQAVKDILGAAFGSAGERCMALPVVVPVGAATAEKFLAKMLRPISAKLWPKARAYCAMGAALNCKGMKTGFSLGRHSLIMSRPIWKPITTRFSAPYCKLSVQKISKTLYAFQARINMAMALRFLRKMAARRVNLLTVSKLAW
jgi:malonate-semialdehyde dehydrogenase (acetylating)/methylmalonate-semialdehyde dehydrogenase